MANKKQALVEKVEFIFSETARLNRIAQEGRLADIPREDAFCDLPHPQHNWPNGKMLCSRAGYDELESLTSAALDRRNLKKVVSLEANRSQMAKILVRKFLREDRPLNVKNVERGMAELARSAEKSRKSITHFLPCHLMLAKSPSEFAIGPVRFLSQQSFRDLFASALRANRKNSGKSSYRFVADVLRYYRTFGWVAQVTIEACDKKTSPNAAHASVWAALNCLHLLFGAGHSEKMTIGGPGLSADTRGTVSIDQSGNLAYSASFGGPGEVGFEDGWLDVFSDHHAQEVISNLGKALEMHVEPSLNRPLSRRLLDSIQWYGEAVREQSRAAKVVKYVTALERLVMTDEKDDIAGIVSERIAALCLHEPTEAAREEWRRNVKRAYDIRSKIVHGSISQDDEIIFEGIRLGTKISREALISATTGLGQDGLLSTDIPNKHLSSWYNELIAHVDRIVTNSQTV